MLLAEYDYETDITVQRAEEHETAKLMKQANCELDFIMQMTRLCKEEIEAL
ncbi:hypothetical protein E4O04_10805 [Treponema sp. OMZ 799]|uniref:hypothetical protein n=1 Tax=unclassified Treponema TaxID=2638727 RepID=UPI0020A5F790|nr:MULTISPECIES: hypothetical protein [unclassified Treponema]UTC67680.1 hypothetical protein E4O06_03125 [Treponema sp. OMZ 789]UTC70408.1 hypothetical protein E4O01_03115 [Treponema sp. OMZ 790]UTC73122.1 hypothetical protein E4O02_03115 [Treponema sp. OMZ 791]UTC78460.1 hypothetical protein E4O04_10805 [Treponema sp. OMZ 799]